MVLPKFLAYHVEGVKTGRFMRKINPVAFCIAEATKPAWNYFFVIGPLTVPELYMWLHRHFENHMPLVFVAGEFYVAHTECLFPITTLYRVNYNSCHIDIGLEAVRVGVL